MMQKVDKIAKYALIVSQDPYFPTGDTHGSVIGLIGDIINGFGENSKQFIDIPSIQQYLVRFQSSTNHKLRETANWVINLIRQIN